jgi:hypothetical protein
MPNNTQLFINGAWTDSIDGATLPVVKPATGESIGNVSHAKLPDPPALARCAGQIKFWLVMFVTPRELHGWILPPLVICAVGVHC